ncbi:MAG: conserved hypothetical rane protein [Rubritepida sp.]|nr:conserved hypothetical rane protein [Rubritepida sp.]
MATAIQLRHEKTGRVKIGYYGFSWTTLFFGFFPALTRGEPLIFALGFTTSIVITLSISWFACLMLWLAWAFVFNRVYTCKLIGRGYEIVDPAGGGMAARIGLGIAARA